MKNLKALAPTLAVGLAASYLFAVLSTKFGPFPGIGTRSPVVGK